MRSFFWPIILLLVLWVLMVYVLPSWVAVQYVPNLVLTGLLVLAITDANFRFYWLAFVVGFLLDVYTSLLIGSFALSLPFVYLIVRYAYKEFIPADKIYVALPITSLIIHILLKFWIVGVGFIGYNIGWPVRPVVTIRSLVAVGVAGVLAAIASLVIYLIWLEVLHRFDRPLRLRR